MVHFLCYCSSCIPIYYMHLWILHDHFFSRKVCLSFIFLTCMPWMNHVPGVNIRVVCLEHRASQNGDHLNLPSIAIPGECWNEKDLTANKPEHDWPKSNFNPYCYLFCLFIDLTYQNLKLGRCTSRQSSYFDAVRAKMSKSHLKINFPERDQNIRKIPL